ncbi:MAG: hypothetical protein ACLQNE_21855 [Thermoguttaceae bacterium]
MAQFLPGKIGKVLPRWVSVASSSNYPGDPRRSQSTVAKSENWWFLFHEGCRVPEIANITKTSTSHTGSLHPEYVAITLRVMGFRHAERDDYDKKE